MPKLPVAENLGIRGFQDRGGVVSPSLDTSGQNALAATVSNISTDVTNRLDASSLHKAKVHFQKAKLEADTAFDQDPDFETYQERYEKRIDQATKESAEMVRNPRDRERFARDMSLYKAQGSQNIIAKAFSKEVDKGRADLEETLTIGRENYLRATTKEDKDFAVQTANDAINAAEQATHLDADTAQSMRQKLALDLAVASIEVAPPEKQLKLLKSSEGVMQYLPLDVRTDMIKRAEGQLDAQTALDASNVIRVEGGDLDERMAKVNKITDPKVKGAVRQQVLADYNVEKTADGEERYDIYDKAAKGIIAGGNLTQFIADNPKEWDKLGSKEQSTLINMVKTKKPTTTNFATYHKLNNLKRDNKEKARRYFLDNVSSFSREEAERQSDYFTSLDEDPKPLFSMKESLDTRIKALDLDDEDSGLAEYRLQEEYDTWARANPGETMDLKTQTMIVDGVFDKAVDKKWYQLGSDKRGFQATRRQADEAKLQKQYQKYQEKYGTEPSVSMKSKIEAKMIRDGLISDYR